MGVSVLKRALAGVAGAAMMLAAGGAQAANHVLNLTGDVLGLTTSSFVFEGKTYETGVLELTGFTPFELADGDTVEVFVALTSGPFVVPQRDAMFLGLNFSDLLGGLQPVTSSSTGSFSLDGGAPLGAGCGNCTSLIAFQANAPWSFTTLAATGSFSMDSPYPINSISLSYQVNNEAAVPEPGTWALMILGFGAAGAALRTRRTAAGRA